MMTGEPFAERYVVRIVWGDKPEALFRMRCYGVQGQRQWSDTGEWTAGKLRVKALEMVCEALRVEYVDCPENVDVYFDQAAVERLTGRVDRVVEWLDAEIPGAYELRDAEKTADNDRHEWQGWGDALSCVRSQLTGRFGENYAIGYRDGVEAMKAKADESDG